jgi:hypothetical protein
LPVSLSHRWPAPKEVQFFCIPRFYRGFTVCRVGFHEHIKIFQIISRTGCWEYAM